MTWPWLIRGWCWSWADIMTSQTALLLHPKAHSAKKIIYAQLSFSLNLFYWLILMYESHCGKTSRSFRRSVIQLETVGLWCRMRNQAPNPKFWKDALGLPEILPRPTPCLKSTYWPCSQRRWKPGKWVALVTLKTYNLSLLRSQQHDFGRRDRKHIIKIEGLAGPGAGVGIATGVSGANLIAIISAGSAAH